MTLRAIYDHNQLSKKKRKKKKQKMFVLDPPMIEQNTKKFKYSSLNMLERWMNFERTCYT